MHDLTRRQLLIAGAASAPLLPAALSRALADAATSTAAVGPLLGHVDHDTAVVWYRPVSAGAYTLRLVDAQTGKAREAAAAATPERDLCVIWRFDGLAPDTEYRYAVFTDGAQVAGGDACTLRTAPPIDAPATTTLAMGSCASSTAFFEIWDTIAGHKPDALMLMGDTPYIDNVELAFNRARHREFLSMPTLAALGARTPIWGTWDDHDFGGNDTDGRVRNKHLIRQAFTEYRAHAQHGDGEHGIYTKFRRGPVEVFMVDARYFSQTEPSPVAPDKPTLLGKTQWAWLLDGLAASTAPFKVLATGMIWDDKQNKEKDDWATYAHEREALFDFIGREKIGGVVLLGGDIHVSRHLIHPLRERVGYDLHEFIVSPLHDRIIPSLNVPHPALQWGEPIPNVFMTIRCDSTAAATASPTLTATWRTMANQTLREVKLTQCDLTSPGAR